MLACNFRDDSVISALIIKTFRYLFFKTLKDTVCRFGKIAQNRSLFSNTGYPCVAEVVIANFFLVVRYSTVQSRVWTKRVVVTVEYFSIKRRCLAMFRCLVLDVGE